MGNLYGCNSHTSSVEFEGPDDMALAEVGGENFAAATFRVHYRYAHEPATPPAPDHGGIPPSTDVDVIDVEVLDIYYFDDHGDELQAPSNLRKLVLEYFDRHIADSTSLNEKLHEAGHDYDPYDD